MLGAIIFLDSMKGFQMNQILSTSRLFCVEIKGWCVFVILNLLFVHYVGGVLNHKRKTKTINNITIDEEKVSELIASSHNFFIQICGGNYVSE